MWESGFGCIKIERGCGLALAAQVQALDLFKPHHVIHQVAELDSGGVAFDTDAPLPQRSHGSAHLGEDVFDPVPHFAALSVGGFLLRSQGVRLAALGVDVCGMFLAARSASAAARL